MLKSAKTMKIKDLFSVNLVQALILVAIFVVFFFAKNICSFYGYDEEEAVERIQDNLIVPEEGEPYSAEGLNPIDLLCNKKGGFLTNLAVAFLVLTVLRTIFGKMK